MLIWCEERCITAHSNTRYIITQRMIFCVRFGIDGSCQIQDVVFLLLRSVFTVLTFLEFHREVPQTQICLMKTVPASKNIDSYLFDTTKAKYQFTFFIQFIWSWRVKIVGIDTLHSYFDHFLIDFHFYGGRGSTQGTDEKYNEVNILAQQPKSCKNWLSNSYSTIFSTGGEGRLARPDKN